MRQQQLNQHSRHPSSRPLQPQLAAFPSQLSLLSLALVSVLASMTPAMAADTTISTSVGAQSWTIDNFTVTNTGTISGGSTGVNASGTIGTLSNSGSISGSNGGVNNNGAITSLTNISGGTINGNRIGVYNNRIIGTLNNSGIINGGNTGVFNYVTIGTLSNSGTISGGSTGIINNGTIGTLSNSGTISSSSIGLNNGGTTGVYNFSGTIGTLSNSGSISSSNIGVNNLRSRIIGTLSNSGTISGDVTGVRNYGSIGILSNSGLITSAGLALLQNTFSTISSFTNTGIIAGNIFSDSAAALNINGGTGATFVTLTGYNGAIGNIDSSFGINFISGNQLLNDNIEAYGGPLSVNNQDGVFQVNNHITITGDYAQSAAATLAVGVNSGATTNGVTADTGYGRLTVTGNATIASGASINLKPITTYAFAAGQRFVVVQTAGTATYNAANLNYSATGFTGSATGASVVEGGNTGLV